jgi:hypothetical protein
MLLTDYLLENTALWCQLPLPIGFGKQQIAKSCRVVAEAATNLHKNGKALGE